MAFCFQRDELVADGIQRLLRERFEASIERFKKSAHSTDPVHAIRKDIKKVRAILRLVQTHSRGKAYRREMDSLRDISGVLAPVRDTQVHLLTLEELRLHFKAKAEDPSFSSLRRILEEEQTQAHNSFNAAQGDQTALKLIQVANDRIPQLISRKLKKDWSTLSKGLRETYQRGKKGLLIARHEGDPDQFHDWRKAVKRLWYQMRLISPAWPMVMEAYSDELGCLGEFLGTDHDLFVLHTIIDRQPNATLPKKQRTFLLDLITQHQKELRRKTLRLGERLYCEKPALFCRRIGLYWNIWRH